MPVLTYSRRPPRNCATNAKREPMPTKANTDELHLAGFLSALLPRLAAGLARSVGFGGNVDVHSSARPIQCLAAAGSLNISDGSCTYSFMGLALIGANTLAPGIASNSARDDSSSLANICDPNVPANMCPFTNEAVCPNIGRTVTFESFGRSVRNNVVVFGSAFGMVGRLATDDLLSGAAHVSHGLTRCSPASLDAIVEIVI